MTVKRFNEIVKEETNYIQQLLIAKQEEYNLDADRMSHFKHASATSGWPAEKCLYGYLLKHIMSITDMINSGETFTRERWIEKITDICNYLILLLGLLEDENKFKESEDVASR